jgi:signal transduction histidine kinase
MKFRNQFLITALMLIFGLRSAGAPIIVYQQENRQINIGRSTEVFEDKENRMTPEEVLQQAGFQPSTQDILNLGLSESTFWVKFTITNLSGSDYLLLELAQPMLDYAALYTVGSDGQINMTEESKLRPFSARKYNHQNYIFDLNVPAQQTRTFLLKVWGREQITLPLNVGETQYIYETLVKKDLIFGLFFGVILIMLFYNLFIYFTVRDPAYIYYVVYILLLALSQAALQGYDFKYLWPGSPWMAQHSIFIFPSLASIAAMFFAKVFLHTGRYVPRLNRFLMVLIGVFVVAIVLGFAGQYRLSFAIMQNNTLLGSLFVISLAVVVLRKGYKSAQYFLFAWAALLLGAAVLVLRDYGIFPSNTFTSNTLIFGSAIEVVLLSFALADKINTLRREREEAQAQTLRAYAENERIIKEQNLILETKVQERTLELQATNEELNSTLTELKEAQTQLVEQEKMASLGQLTAGIAHEINNPINFVTSNVAPLQRDIQLLQEAFVKIEELALSDLPAEEKHQQISEIKEDIEYDYLREEIEFLLKGIAEGSNRTAEIVKGLRVFSRVDEDDLKRVNIHEGIDSTLIIINSLLNNHIKVVCDYAEVPPIECYPGKLNQVFLNILTNAIHAVDARWEQQEGGEIRIQTLLDGEEVEIRLGDNGTGMDSETAAHIFEPFFTTKDVGEGTGLGLSIVYNIIRKHNGTITMESTPGVGTTFVIRIPVKQKTV